MFSGTKVFFKWWATWKSIPVLSWVRAALLYKAGRFEQAISMYNKGLERHPRHPARYCARLDKAYCLFKLKRFEEAETILRQVIVELPRSREAHIRLARLHMWTGNYLEAAWCARRALLSVPHDAELVAIFLISLLENGGPSYLVNDAIGEFLKANPPANDPILDVARACLLMHRGEREKAVTLLNEVVALPNPPFEAYMYLGEALLKNGQASQARKQLRMALTLAPEYPRLLSLCAESYFVGGTFYNPDYARQLATTAAQNANWLSPWAMHTLAEAYRLSGDRMAALIMASKAKEVGIERLGSYRNSKRLDDLIDNLSSTTLA